MEASKDHNPALSKKSQSKDHDYSFLVEFPHFGAQKDPKMYCHPLLGMPTIPMLGKYSNQGYEFGRALSLVSFDLKFDGISWKNEYDKQNFHEINLPPEISVHLLEIPQKIEENKKPDEDDKDSKFKQQTLDNFLTSKPKRKHDKDADFFPTDSVQFDWSIQLNNIPLGPKDNGQRVVYNYVMHTVLFPDINFEKTKRIMVRTPIGLIIPNDISKICGTMSYIDPEKGNSKYFNGLKLNSLRMEYSSTHMKQGALCFSPNNMKIVLDLNTPISFFWTVVLDEMMLANKCHLHWIVNDKKLFSLMEGITKSATNLTELMNGFEGVLGKDSHCLKITRKTLNVQE